MAIAGGNIQLDSTEGMDKITQTEKVTTPYFSDGSTTLLGANVKSASNLTSTNETYFYGIANSSTTTTEEFNVAFGSKNGYGANVETNTKSETAAIYGQYASLLLAPTEVTGGFHISSPGSTSKISSGPDDEIFIISARRGNMKDRINKGSWEIAFSGSNFAGTGGAPVLHLKDDSSTTDPTATPAGDRYNIVSCSTAGAILRAATVTNYGFFYPDAGIIVLSQKELSGSIPGSNPSGSQVAVLEDLDHTGFHIAPTTNEDKKNPLRLINCLQAPGTKLTFRDEEDQVSAQYFCRIRSGQMNFSNNPTFVSGSLNELRHKTMKGNPTVFITQVQLYNAAGHMVAVGNLSTPLKKNFSSEATIKVKLTY